jgi:energy-coupling factor transporter ATP-binding protein EcfA2
MEAQAIAVDGTDTALVILNGVSYRYPKSGRNPILEDINLSVHLGRYLLISGASGSGKSTLARTFNGLIPHFYGGRLTGRISIAGRAVQDCTVADCFHQVALVSQNPQAQLFSRTVIQELAFGLESLGLNRKVMDARIQAVAAEMDIGPLLERSPQTLSGGEQQLVAIAAVLAAQPQMVVLDEPLANLDPVHVRRLRQILSRQLDQGRGVVVCEHRMGSTLPDAHEVVLLHRGCILLQGPVKESLEDPLWQESAVELPLAVRVGAALQQTPPPREVIDISPHSARAWLATQAPYPPAIESPQGKPVMRAENIEWTIDGRNILDSIDMELYAGQCTAIVGANGAGKTSLIKIINGLIRPSRGRVWINGKETTGRPAWQVAHHVGTAFQNPDSQFFKLTVAQELAVGPHAQGCYDAQWIGRLIDLFHLQHVVDRAPFKLSGGEKKRVAFACALAAKPAILVLDEPTAGQDSRFGRALSQCINTLCAQGTAVIIVTHALNFAEAVASHWIVMNQGRIIARGTPHAIMADYAVMTTAGLEPTERFRLWHKAHHAA